MASASSDVGPKVGAQATGMQSRLGAFEADQLSFSYPDPRFRRASNPPEVTEVLSTRPDGAFMLSFQSSLGAQGRSWFASDILSVGFVRRPGVPGREVEPRQPRPGCCTGMLARMKACCMSFRLAVRVINPMLFTTATAVLMAYAAFNVFPQILDEKGASTGHYDMGQLASSSTIDVTTLLAALLAVFALGCAWWLGLLSACEKVSKCDKRCCIPKLDKGVATRWRQHWFHGTVLACVTVWAVLVILILQVMKNSQTACVEASHATYAGTRRLAHAHECFQIIGREKQICGLNGCFCDPISELQCQDAPDLVVAEPVQDTGDAVVTQVAEEQACIPEGRPLCVAEGSSHESSGSHTGLFIVALMTSIFAVLLGISWLILTSTALWLGCKRSDAKALELANAEEGADVAIADVGIADVVITTSDDVRIFYNKFSITFAPSTKLPVADFNLGGEHEPTRVMKMLMLSGSKNVYSVARTLDGVAQV